MLLHQLLADQTFVKEEQCPASALACVDVAGEVTVVVLYEVLRTGTPWVVQAVVGGACDVAEDPLDGLLMLRRRSLHEATDVANGERQVWPRVDEVAKAAHNAPVLHGITLLRHAAAAQPQPLHHGSVG